LCLFQDILPKIDSCLSKGINDFYIIGHSQGGAISYLLTSMLYDLKARDVRYENLTIKTYASAAPKPGNLYYAYEYEALTQKGWAFNVVNSADWVPEGPFSIQTTNDYNTLNPFKSVDEALKKTSFPKNIILKHVYNQLDKPTKNLIKILDSIWLDKFNITSLILNHQLSTKAQIMCGLEKQWFYLQMKNITRSFLIMKVKYGNIINLKHIFIYLKNYS
jgi:hypothetical protein